MSYDYAKLKKKYNEFLVPASQLKVNGSDFQENKANLVISDLTVELSTGYEASEAVYSIYNVFDYDTCRYRFDDFSKYCLLGSQVSISAGYMESQTEIFTGVVTQVRFVCNDENSHHVEVTAMDVKGMMMANCRVAQLKAKNYSGAVKEIFSGTAYSKMLEKGIFKGIEVTQTPDAQSEEQSKKDTSYTVEMVSESDYEFVVKAARHFNYEFFVDTGTVIFREAKKAAEETLIELGGEKGIIEYDISYDITGLVKTVEVRGMDTAKAKAVSVKKKVSNTISTGNKAKALIDNVSKVIIDAAAITKEQAQYKANSVMEDIAYRFGTLQCKCVGLPELMPGNFIRISDLGTPCDNRFYMTNVKHVITDTEGYVTYITAKAAELKEG